MTYAFSIQRVVLISRVLWNLLIVGQGNIR
jgi:hypothetical protein